MINYIETSHFVFYSNFLEIDKNQVTGVILESHTMFNEAFIYDNLPPPSLLLLFLNFYCKKSILIYWRSRKCIYFLLDS